MSTLANAEELSSEIAIPPQPEILINIRNELNKQDPNINLISKNIIKDASLFSSILRLINSPYFGMRTEIKSIPHAISLIGLENLMTNIASIEFRKKIKGSDFVSMPRYWDNASDVAKLSSYIAKELGVSSPPEAYAIGLFKDSGLPVLAQHFSGYKEVLKQQNETELKNYTDLEDSYFNTNHSVVSYLLTKQWGMNKVLREACLYHHDVDYITDDSFDDDQESRKLILIAKIAGYVANMDREEPRFEWTKIKDFILFYFGLSEPDFFELCENMKDVLTESTSI